MRTLAPLATGVFTYLVAAALTGRLPQLRRPARQGSAEVSPRQLWLVQAGADLTPRQFLTGSLIAATGTLALVITLTGTPAVAIVPAVAVGFGPRAYFSRRRSARLREVQEAWPDGLRDLTASITAGLSLHQAIVALAAGGPQPLRHAFGGYPLLASVLGVVPALEVVKEELADPTSDRVIEVLILAHERGGHILIEILRDLAEATTKDVHALEEIETDILEQRINARTVLILPWLVLLVLTAQPGHFRTFYRSPGGLLVVTAAAVLSLVGMWLVGRLGRDPGEQRVFGAGSGRGTRP